MCPPINWVNVPVKRTVTSIMNKGVCENQEIIQLYISDKKSSLPRPVKELKSFRKVTLAPGETKEVSFTIAKDSLSFFDDAKHEWIAGPGKFEASYALAFSPTFTGDCSAWDASF